MSYVSKLTDEEIINLLRKHGLKPTIVYDSSGTPLPPIERSKQDIFIRCKNTALQGLTSLTIINKMLNTFGPYTDFSITGLLLTDYDAIFLTPNINQEGDTNLYNDLIDLLSTKFGEKYIKSLQAYNSESEEHQKEI